MLRGANRFHGLLFIENFQHFLQLYQIVFLYYVLQILCRILFILYEVLAV